MKAVILHGTGSSHANNWFPWVKGELEKLGYDVWVPDLPRADHPNIERYNKFLLSKDWDFQNNLIVGHSSGAVEILGLLPALPKDVVVNTVILVGSFTKRLVKDPSWAMLKELFYKPFDFEAIKKKAKQIIFVHSEDDPYCPIEQAQELHKKIGGEFIKFKGRGHFSSHLDPRFSKFPELIDIIKQKVHE